jgi:hypothetical protein
MIHQREPSWTPQIAPALHKQKESSQGGHGGGLWISLKDFASEIWSISTQAQSSRFAEPETDDCAGSFVPPARRMSLAR